MKTAFPFALRFWLATLLTLGFAGCASSCPFMDIFWLGLKKSSLPTMASTGELGEAEVESVLEDAFRAIADNDWPGFQALTVTTSDLMLDRMRVNRFQAPQTYVGGVLKAEELQKLQADFKQAVEGGESQIDFKQAKFLGVGQRIDSGEWELLETGSFPYGAFTLRIKANGKEFQTDQLRPLFLVTVFRGRARIFKLDFGGDEPVAAPRVEKPRPVEFPSGPEYEPSPPQRFEPEPPDNRGSSFDQYQDDSEDAEAPPEDEDSGDDGE